MSWKSLDTKGWRRTLKYRLTKYYVGIFTLLWIGSMLLVYQSQSHFQMKNAKRSLFFLANECQFELICHKEGPVDAIATPIENLPEHCKKKIQDALKGFVPYAAYVASFKAYVPVMESMDTYPLYPNIRMRHFLRAIGMKENTNREFALQGENRNTSLNYPSAPITRKAHGKTNIVWLVAESLRADMLTSEIMPNAWRMASRGWRFPLHFSGGNGTRPGMFSMFYGLYANNWNAFLRSSRSPLVLDWFKEDGAAFLCQTSAKFTYPEFDRTIFSGVKPEDMKEYGKGKAWERDIDNANAAADFIRRQKGESPFFLFCFFECTHAPYSFPENEALRKDYLQSINYALVSQKDASRLYNRSVNAAHHLDVQLDRIFKALEESEALDNTIIILTGDHGEEFYEKGRLGHNSAFTHEQMHVPLVLLAPGLKPNVYEDAAKATGVFYFWGHSYENFEYDGLWGQLEEKIKIITEDPDTEWANVIDIVK